MISAIESSPKPGLEEQPDRLGGLDLLLAEHAVVGAGLGQAEQPPDPQHLVRRHAGPLLDLRAV